MEKLLLLVALIGLVFALFSYDIAVLCIAVVISFIFLASMLYICYFALCNLLGLAYEHRKSTIVAILAILLLTGYPSLFLVLAFVLLLGILISKAYNSEYATDLREKYVPIARKEASRIPLIGSFFLGYWLASGNSKDSFYDECHHEGLHHNEEHTSENSIESDYGYYEGYNDYSGGDSDFYGGGE